MPVNDLLIALSVPLLWGFGLAISKLGMEQLPPMLINGLRWIIAGLVLVWWFPIPTKFMKNLLHQDLILKFSLFMKGHHQRMDCQEFIM